ncbi:tRNA (guanosine(37)-N1)-methyltransferase TrmD [Desulfococcus sp.]|uniref:tRNA (guanosine(37)-N1)-methyltransferase TrmD n=1 Tax=Desulfococcus sp. TaxID=2025834 RepID=UPI003593DBA6
MNFVVLTIFPEMFTPFWENGMIKRAIEGKHISASAVDIRQFASDRHRTTDDRPYGGGAGMVMKPEPLAEAIRAAKKSSPFSRTVLMTPQGRRFSQPLAHELAGEEGVIFVCGRYEGVDERIFSGYIDDEISIGDYVLTGGELPAMIVIDAVARLLPGVLGGSDSAEKDSFSEGLLEHAHFTRPREFEGHGVPEVLLSGDHRAIERWRTETSLIRTFLKRPDLLENRRFTPREIEILRKWCAGIERIIEAQSLPGAGSLSGGE